VDVGLVTDVEIAKYKLGYVIEKCSNLREVLSKSSLTSFKVVSVLLDMIMYELMSVHDTLLKVSDALSQKSG